MHLRFNKHCSGKTANDSFVSKTGLRVRDFGNNAPLKRDELAPILVRFFAKCRKLSLALINELSLTFIRMGFIPTTTRKRTPADMAENITAQKECTNLSISYILSPIRMS